MPCSPSLVLSGLFFGITTDTYSLAGICSEKKIDFLYLTALSLFSFLKNSNGNKCNKVLLILLLQNLKLALLPSPHIFK